MEKYIVNTGTITYALRARDLLRSKGVSAHIFRKSGKDAVGCGYGVSAVGDKKTVTDILTNGGVKYISLVKGETV